MRNRSIACMVAGALIILSAVLSSPAAALEPAPDGLWYWQEPQPGGSWFTDVSSPDGVSAWAVAEDGVVLATSDAGVTWHAQVTGTTADLRAVAAVDRLTVFVVGSPGDGLPGLPGVLLRTTDGGADWQSLAVGDAGFVPAAVDFVDATHGWVTGFTQSGYRSAAYATNDGGLSWTRLSLSGHGVLTCVDFYDVTHGWIGDESQTVYRTDDGGVTWHGVDLAVYGVGRIAAVGPSSVWILADGEPGWVPCRKLFFSEDGGRTFGRRLTGLTRLGGASDLVFDAAGRGVIGGPGVLWKTADAGATWTRRSAGVDVWALSGKPGGTLYATDVHTVSVSPDGGNCWPSALGGRSIAVVLDAQALAGHQGWVLALGPTEPDGEYRTQLYFCGDGLRWDSVRVAPWANTMAFADDRRGVVAGEDGRVLSTSDGGATWNLSRLGDGYRLTAAANLDGSAVWVAGTASDGRRARLWRSADGGSTWTAVALPRDTNPRDMTFVDAGNGWIAGSEGEEEVFTPGHVLRTRDGGLSWSDVTPEIESIGGFGAVDFVDPLHGWVLTPYRYPAGVDALLHTVDGGETWSVVEGVDWISVGDVDFADAEHGCVAGDPSYRTDDGGRTWRQVALPGDPSVVTFAPDGSGLAGSREGVLLSTWDQPGDVLPPQLVCPAPWGWRRSPVTLRIASTDPGGSGVARQESAIDQQAVWQPGDQVVVGAPADHSNDGRHTVFYRAVDNSGNVATERTSVWIDTLGPETKALERTSVVRGRRATLVFRVDDALSDQARVRFEIRDASGRLVLSLPARWRMTGKRLSTSFRCDLRPGRYVYEVLALDLARNEQTVEGRNVLRVR